jgi:hypothetical protein
VKAVKLAIVSFKTNHLLGMDYQPSFINGARKRELLE